MVMKVKPARRKCSQCGHYYVLVADGNYSQEFIDAHLCFDCWNNIEYTSEDFEEDEND